MAVAVDTEKRWLYGPVPDLLLGCGLLYALLFLVMLGVGPAMRSTQPLALFPIFMLLLSTPHYGATLLRVYEQRSDRRAYAIFSVWITLALCFLFAVAVHVNWLGTLMLTVYLTWSPWHYTGQNYGIAVMFLRRRGVDLDDTTKRWLYASFISSYVMLFFVMHGTLGVEDPMARQFEGGSIHLAYLGIPRAITSLAVPAVGVFYLAATGVAVARLSKKASLRDLLPVLALCLTQALWFSVPEAARYFHVTGGFEVVDFDYRTYYFSWIVFGHAIQYLWITSYYARASSNWGGQVHYFGKVLLAGNAAWLLPAVLLTPDGLGGVSYDLGLGLLVASLVNLHHFILDGAIWKLRQSRVAGILIRREPAAPPDLPEAVAAAGTSGLRKAAWAGLGVLLLASAAEIYESKVRIPAALEAGDFAAASTSLDRLAWIAQDSAIGRSELGTAFLMQGEPERARAEYERSLELEPGLHAHAGLGRLHFEAGRYREALASYRGAIEIDDSSAELHAYAGLAHAALGESEAARAAYLRALALDAHEPTALAGLRGLASPAATRPPSG